MTEAHSIFGNDLLFLFVPNFIKSFPCYREYFQRFFYTFIPEQEGLTTTLLRLGHKVQGILFPVWEDDIAKKKIFYDS